MRMGDLVIRDARPDELDAVADLLDASFAQYMPGSDAPADRRAAFDAYRVELRDVRARLHDSVLIVAEDTGTVLGAVTLYTPRGDEPVGDGWPAGWAAIRLLAAHPRARGRGIGRALTEECLRRARALGAPVVGLRTTELMSVARAMYERMGFTRIPEYDFYPTPDFCVMAYRLDL